MSIDISTIYYNVLKSHLDPKKFLELNNCDKLLNALFLLDNSISPDYENKMESWMSEIKKTAKQDLQDRHKYSRTSDELEQFRKLYTEDKSFKKSVNLYLSRIVRKISKQIENSEIIKRSEALKKLLSIGEFEIQVIFSLIILKRLNSKITKLPVLLGMYNDFDSFREVVFTRDKISFFIGDSNLSTISIIPKDSILIRSGLIDAGRFNTIAISDKLFNYFTNELADISTIHNLETKAGATFPLSSFAVSKEEIKLCTNLLESNRPCSILLIGEPGAGKTQMSRSLAQNLGKQALFIPVKECKGDDGLQIRKSSLRISTNIMEDFSNLIILDEADEILNTSMDNPFRMLNSSSSINKSWVNEILDSNKAKLIVISNHETMDPSTLRRFSLIIKFKKLNQEQRLTMLQNTLAENGASDILTIDEQMIFAEKAELSQGIIALALKDANAFSENVEDKKEAFLGIITNKHNFHNNSKLDLSKNEKSFSPEGFRMSISLETIEAKLAYYLDENNQNRWKPEQISLLFFGLSGSGKTSFAAYLARRFDKKLISISSSTLMNKYVGETEKQIRAIFQEAEATKSFLFIDEVEGLLKGRSEGDKKYEISQVNEFLVSLEKFKGVFMTATNFPDILDSALSRRFSDKIEFLPPDINGRVKLVQNYFSDQISCQSEELTHLLSSLEGLCAGHIKAVKNSLAYRENVSIEELYFELNKSMGTKRKAVGILT